MKEAGWEQIRKNDANLVNITTELIQLRYRLVIFLFSFVRVMINHALIFAMARTANVPIPFNPGGSAVNLNRFDGNWSKLQRGSTINIEINPIKK